MAQPEIDWSDFDAASGILAMEQLQAISPRHIPAITGLLRQGATIDQIVARFRGQLPTWDAHLNYVRLTAQYLASLD